MHEVVHILELATAGFTVVSTGAALFVVYAVFSPTMHAEVREEFRRKPM